MKFQPVDLKMLSVLNADDEGTQPKCVGARKSKRKRLAKEPIPERGKVITPVHETASQQRRRRGTLHI